MALKDRYFDLKSLSESLPIGVSTLRGLIRSNGLPHFRLPGRILVKQSEFDTWMTRFACNREQEIGELADSILKDFKRVSE